jgi:hypothetical protein
MFTLDVSVVVRSLDTAAHWFPLTANSVNDLRLWW